MTATDVIAEQSATTLTGELLDAPAAPETARPIWASACAGVTRLSYFLSQGWIETWLASLPPTARPRLLCFRTGGEVTGACFLGHRKVRRHAIFSSNAVFLNETGHPGFDQLCVEHNGIVCREGSQSTGDDLIAALPEEWDEIFLSGISTTSPLLNVSAPYICRKLRIKPSPAVDLDAVRARPDYLDLLSSSTRTHIRRSYRLYAETGGRVSSCCANNLDQALAFFDELVSLHSARWSKRGNDGAFKNPFMVDFHRRLIATRYQTGEIQLFRVTAGTLTIGIVYNFVYHGVVYFYQSGFRYENDNRLKPGLVTHTEAIRFNAKAGHATYDFLAGESRYKQSLATSSTDLVWAVIQKPRLKFKIEEMLRDVKDAVQARRNGRTASDKRNATP